KYLEDMTATPSNKTEMMKLSITDASKVVETLKIMFPDHKNGSPFLDANTDQNAIVARGTVQQLKDVRDAIRVIEGVGEAGGGNAGSADSLRIITLKEGSAATLAKALEEMLKKLRPETKVDVIRPGNEFPDGKPEPNKPDEKKILPKKSGEPKPGKYDISFGEEKQPEKDKDKDKDKGKDKSQLADPQKGRTTITAFGNKLIVSGDDPKALALVQDLVRLYTTTQSGPGDFEIIKVKKASAIEIAKVIDEAFNGPKQQGPRPGGFGMGDMIRGFMTGGRG